MQIDLETPLQYIKGVGPRIGDQFKEKSIHTVEDLIYFFPRKYQDNRVIDDLSTLHPNTSVTIRGSVIDKNIIPLRGRGSKKIYQILVGDASNHIVCKFFKAPYRGWFNTFNVGDSVQVRGLISEYRNKLEFHHPQIFPISEESEIQKEDLLIPIYSEIENISQIKIKKIMKTAIDSLFSIKDEIDWLPLWIKEKYHLIDLYSAIQGIHQPDIKKIDEYFCFQNISQRRIIFDDFFESQIYLSLKKRGWKVKKSKPLPIDKSFLEEIKNKLPFQLTDSQNKTIEEIIGDLESNHLMYRLLQGEVGSGKTIVALIISLLVAKLEFQVAIMVPTEILAEQHYQNISKFLEPFNIKVEKLTGQMKESEKRIVSGVLKSGFCQVCIGTHALIQENIQFKNLRLVIIDEQHRFGTHQRGILKNKGKDVHFLVMTATPIPRTLSLSFYGDLDVSTIKELPKGRKPIITKKVFFNRRLEIFNFLKQQVENGNQGYVIYPLIEESEALDLKNVMEQYEKLKSYYKDLKWGILTGRMSSEEKKDAMDRFRKNEIQVLVSTTAIEVGIDVSNANVMIVEHSERFGLSQLHQLRGRIGRGKDQSYFFVVLGKNHSEASKHRATLMEEYSDGFRISEKDLEMRGPGEFLGIRQSGLLTFRFANISRDIEILNLSRDVVNDLLHKDMNLTFEDNKKIREKFHKISKFIKPG